MYIEYTWILRQGKNCCQNRWLTWNAFIRLFAHPTEGEGKGVDGGGGIVIIASYEFYFIKALKNPVQHPNNNTYIDC